MPRNTPGYCAAGTLCEVSTDILSEVHAAGVHSEKIHYLVSTQDPYMVKHRELTAQLDHPSNKHTDLPVQSRSTQSNQLESLSQ